MIHPDWGIKILNGLFYTNYSKDKAAKEDEAEKDYSDSKITYSEEDYNEMKTNFEHSNKIQFPKNVYIALLVGTLPSAANGFTYSEPTATPSEDEPDKTYKNYRRQALTKEGISYPNIMEEAARGTYDPDSNKNPPNVGKDETADVAVIKNQDIIVFPETKTAAYNEPVIGFAIFEYIEGGVPILWGELQYDKDEFPNGVPVGKNKIPVFRAEELKFILGTPSSEESNTETGSGE